MEKSQLFVVIGILGSLVLVVGIALIVNQMKFGGDPAKLLTHGKFAHWHAQMSAVVCGQEQAMPKAAPGGELGSGPIHTHDDGLAHMEGVFNSLSDLAVRKYLVAVGVPFSEKGIFTKSDGSPCNPEASSSAHFYGTVNDQPVENILDYPMHDPNKDKDDQQDKIRFIYE